MSVSYSHGREFVVQVRPFLEARDFDGLVRHLHAYWPGRMLRGLLHCGHEDAAKVALVCIALTGSASDLPEIAPLLASDDFALASVAEHTMWALWFRSGDAWANRRMMHAVRLISAGRHDLAIRCLARIIKHSPDFAEAHNQRAIAHFLKEDYTSSIADCLQTLELNPYHFGAAAGLGHCYAALGDLGRAMESYQLALRLHPQLEGIRRMILELREVLEGIARPEVPVKPAKPATS